MIPVLLSADRLTALRQLIEGRPPPPTLACGSVRDFCDSMDHVPELTSIQHDMKDLQRPWMLKTILSMSPARGRLLEIGAGEPYVADLLARSGHEVWVVDPYDGSGHGPTDFDSFAARYPSLKFIRAQFGTHLTEVPVSGFDVIYSISVLEHIPHPALLDVIDAVRRDLRPGGWSIHAIDHVHLGNGADYHLRTLQLLCREHHINEGELARVLGAVDKDPDIYLLSAEAHNQWRGKQLYDAFPMRRCISIHLAAQMG